MSAGEHTQGPWRWEFNAELRILHLVGGKPKFDLTVLDFQRWGMNGATMRLRDTAHKRMQLLYPIHERPDWATPEPGREHHKDWHQLLTHPDARLIESAPDLLTHLRIVALHLRRDDFVNNRRLRDEALHHIETAIAKATGEGA